MQKDLVDLSKHYIHVIDALVSLERAECFALKKNTQKQLHSSSKIVSLRSKRFRGIQMYKINFVSRDLCMLRTLCGPVCLHALRTCLFRTLTHSLTHSLLHEQTNKQTKMCQCIAYALKGPSKQEVEDQIKHYSQISKSELDLD